MIEKKKDTVIENKVKRFALLTGKLCQHRCIPCSNRHNG